MEPERVDAVVGEPVTLSLGPAAAGGYAWIPEVPDGVHLVDAQRPPAGARRSGPPSPQGAITDPSVTVVPEVEGSHHVTFRLIRAAQPEETIRERVFELVVAAR